MVCSSRTALVDLSEGRLGEPPQDEVLPHKAATKLSAGSKVGGSQDWLPHNYFRDSYYLRSADCQLSTTVIGAGI